MFHSGTQTELYSPFFFFLLLALLKINKLPCTACSKKARKQIQPKTLVVSVFLTQLQPLIMPLPHHGKPKIMGPSILPHSQAPKVRQTLQNLVKCRLLNFTEFMFKRKKTQKSETPIVTGHPPTLACVGHSLSS